MKNKVYGIDYNLYFCDGFGNQKIALADNKTKIFTSETEMLTALIELKKDSSIGDIKLFEAMAEQIITDRQDYKIG